MQRFPNRMLSCTGLVAIQLQILFTNLITACCMLNTLLHLSHGASHYCDISFDTADGLMRPVFAQPVMRIVVGLPLTTVKLPDCTRSSAS